MLREGVGRDPRVAVLLGTGRILRPVQRLCLGSRETEYEVFWKSPGVTLDLLIDAFGSLEMSVFVIRAFVRLRARRGRGARCFGASKGYALLRHAIGLESRSPGRADRDRIHPYTATSSHGLTN